MQFAWLVPHSAGAREAIMYHSDVSKWITMKFLPTLPCYLPILVHKTISLIAFHVDFQINSPTYTDNVHEAIHSITDLEEQVLALPFGRRTESWPDEPWDTGDEEEGTQNGCCYLNLLDNGQRDGLPLHKCKGKKKGNTEGRAKSNGKMKDRRKTRVISSLFSSTSYCNYYPTTFHRDFCNRRL